MRILWERIAKRILENVMDRLIRSQKWSTEDYWFDFFLPPTKSLSLLLIHFLKLVHRVSFMKI